MRIATWNINSVRLRMKLVEKLSQEAAPDILCLQETKVEDSLFPSLPLQAMGYTHLAYKGGKSYNGVAILSRVPLTNITSLVFGGEHNDCRHIAATLPDGTVLHNFYVPAGGDEPDPEVNPKFAHKLRFMDDMAAFFQKHHAENDKLILVGDLNIAPLEHDVWSHKQLLTVVSHTPVEVEKMERLRSTLSWVDTHRHFVPSNQKLYSWWSYRNRDWRKSNRGRRLDHIWVTPSLQERLSKVLVLKDVRDWEQPSDHVPVVTELA